MKRKLLTPSLLALVLLVSALLTGCDRLESAAAKEPSATQPPVVEEASAILVEGHIAPRDSTQLFFAISGIVDEVLVKEGDEVVKGDVLARLGDRESYEAAVTAAELELTDAQQKLDDLKDNAGLAYGQALNESAAAQRAYTDAQQELADLDTDDYQDELDDAKTKVIHAKEDLDDAQEEYDKYKDLDKDNSNRKNSEDDLEKAQDDYDQAVRDLELLINDLDQVKAKVEATRARFEDAQRQADKRKDGPDPDKLALAEARLNNTQAQLASAQTAQEKLDLVAPFDGTIVTLDIAPGERAIANQPILLLADFSEWYVETSDLTENEVVNIRLGQRVIVIPDALPGLQLSGRVEEISNAYSEKAGDITYEVRILLNNTDPLLRWGMTVEVQLDNQEK